MKQKQLRHSVVRLTSWPLIVFWVVVSLVFASCADPAGTGQPTQEVSLPPQEEPAQESRVVKIGVLAPLTGWASAYGEEMVRGARLAAKEINAAGGVNGYTFEVVSADTKELSSDAVLTAFEKLASDPDVEVMMTGFASSTNFEIEKMAEIDMPYLIGASPPRTEDIIAPNPDDYPTVWSLTPSYDAYETELPKVVELLASEGKLGLENKKVAIVTSGFSYNKRISDGLKEAFEERGWTITVDEMVPFQETHDWRAILSKVRSDPPALIVYTGPLPANATSFMEQFTEDPTDSLVLIHRGSSVQEFVELTQEKSTGVLYNLLGRIIQSPKLERAQDIMQRFEDEYGVEMDTFGMRLYEQVYLYGDALEKVGDATDHIAIGNALRDTDKTTSFGQLQFDPETHLAKQGNDYLPMQVYQIWEGDRVLIYPEKYAAREFRPPPWLAHGPSTAPESAVAQIGDQGGQVRTESGAEVVIPAGVFADEVKIEVTEDTQRPEPPPEYATETAGPAYEVTVPPGTQLNGVVDVRLPLERKAGVGDDRYTILRWDGSQWWDAGGVVEGDMIQTSTDRFSVFVPSIRPSTAPRRPIGFVNTGSYNAVVRPWTYTPAGSSAAAVPPSVAVASFAPNSGGPWPNPSRFMRLPLGSYTFCISWHENQDEDADGYTDYYHYIRSRPVSLNENSPDSVELATEVRFAASRRELPGYQAGRCPNSPRPSPRVSTPIPTATSTPTPTPVPPTAMPTSTLTPTPEPPTVTPPPPATETPEPTCNVHVVAEFEEDVENGAIGHFFTSTSFTANFCDGFVQGTLRTFEMYGEGNRICVDDSGNFLDVSRVEILTYYNITWKTTNFDTSTGAFSARIEPRGEAVATRILGPFRHSECTHLNDDPLSAWNFSWAGSGTLSGTVSRTGDVNFRTDWSLGDAAGSTTVTGSWSGKGVVGP